MAGKQPSSINFSLSVTNGRSPSGKFLFKDPQKGLTITAQRITSIVVSNTKGVVYGVAVVQGKGIYNFVLTVQDLGEKGAGIDTFSLKLGDGYYVSSAIRTGNISVQPK
jgi:hypothetical protein